MSDLAFIFDDVRIKPDKQIGLHSCNNWELSYVLTGSGSRTIGDFTEPFYPGEVVLIPPDIPHVWRFDPDHTDEEGNIANISVYFDTSTLVALRTSIPEISDAIAHILQLDHAVGYTGEKLNSIQELLNRIRGKTPEKRFPLMMELLLAISDTSESVGAGKKSSLTRTERRLEKARVYCACNYARPITLDEISSHVGMNKSAFCTFMRHNAGTTFSEYLNNMRLERAKEKLLRTDRGIAEIAILCGFQNVAYFNRLFRRKYGCSPKEMIKDKKGNRKIDVNCHDFDKRSV